jgi:hypothetical protein
MAGGSTLKVPGPIGVLGFLASLCSCATESPQIIRRQGPAADLVVFADLEGVGADSLVLGLQGESGARLQLPSKELPLPGFLQKALSADLDGDGNDELYLATGQGPGFREEPLRILQLKGGQLHTLWERGGPRGVATELRAMGNRLFLAHFADSRLVESGFLLPGQNTLTQTMTYPLAMRQYPLPDGRRLVSRLYGEQPKSPGDLRIHGTEGGEGIPLLGFRGARSLAMGNLDGDPELELLVGDGWDADYGKVAIARLGLLDGANYEESRTLAQFLESYSVEEIEVVGSGPRACLLIQASRAAHLLCRDNLGWRPILLGELRETDNLAWTLSGGELLVALSGPTVQELHIELW